MVMGPGDLTSQQMSLFDEASAALPTPATAAALVAPAPAPAPEDFRHPRSQREIVLASHRVAYELRRSRRRSIGFVVGAEGLSVSAPRWVGVGEIESALREKTHWVLRKLHEQRERSRRLDAARVQWRAGAAFRFLGQSVVLVLDARISGAVLHTGAQGLPGAAYASMRPEVWHDLGASFVRAQSARLWRRLTPTPLTSIAARWAWPRLKRPTTSSPSSAAM